MRRDPSLLAVFLRGAAGLCAGAGTWGCGVPVTIGYFDASSSTSAASFTGSTLDTSDVGTPDEPFAIALRFGDLPATGETSSSEGGSGGGSTGAADDVDPDALLVVIASAAVDCSDPFAAGPCGNWRVSFTLPPELQLDGASGALDTHNGTASFSEGDGLDCAFGGGSLMGTFEIAAIDDAAVDVALTDLDATFAVELIASAARCQ